MFAVPPSPPQPQPMHFKRPLSSVCRPTETAKRHKPLTPPKAPAPADHTKYLVRIPDFIEDEDRSELIGFMLGLKEIEHTVFLSPQAMPINDEGCAHFAGPMEKLLLKVRASTAVAFNCAVVRFLESSEETVSWKSDMGPWPGSMDPRNVATVSLGASRHMLLRLKGVCTTMPPESTQTKWHLTDGSLFCIRGKSQTFFEVCMPQIKHASCPYAVVIIFGVLLPTDLSS
ncbi:hypothetical protein ml_36 [Mollivirus sibericum]|uniref:hypothetical protein n=1 Tax=Mollivirus sibericum TaxID=1678078 RepID=UPI0006B2E5EE|nr:hypothetical protein ml_36 [Mollivirus sibericum]ALD61838.1 hypothetical protein ml_36 [Mollivirus sibericum]